MDPLTVISGCVSLVATISKLSISMLGFIHDVRGARSDFNTVSCERLSFKTVLKLPAKDAAESNASGFSDTLRKQVTCITSNCNGVLEQTDELLEKQGGSRMDKAARWALFGQNHVGRLWSSLKAHKSALEIALDMISNSWEIKQDASEIHQDISAIKDDTAQILAEMQRLQAQLLREASESAIDHEEASPPGRVSYEETFIEEEKKDMPIHEMTLPEHLKTILPSRSTSPVLAADQYLPESTSNIRSPFNASNPLILRTWFCRFGS
ncbi:hypothetical protein P154DRAFT_578097 [Amniculicola lignicola CBS 123094]|uniref:Fungal N-terminal domain-containing protein n=1 Tax=Amniculicola lignicola CBS 123094 TaxID=1392246 RepID=A0A6A5WA36_9PLEO|nr:hypothetical protein P154DRAFT_578097 [Amniculicola lignicola CBS 123094]